jgi:uncharacterized protein YbjT (DUF2867 family)
MQKKVLITGATGQQGGAVIDELLKAGYEITGTTRNPFSEKARLLSDNGVRMVRADFSDPSTLVSAMKGIDTVFAMSTPYEKGTAIEAEQGITLVRAAADAGIEHLVYTSVGDADRNTGIPHFDSKFKVEEFIRETGINATIIAPVFFMDNLKSPWYAPALKEGKFTHAVPPQRKLQMISLRSIGQFAASIIARGKEMYGKRFNIADDELSGTVTAQILSEITGRTIVYQGFSPEVMMEQNRDFALMYEWFDRVGYSADTTFLKTNFPEVNWQSFREWAAAEDWSMVQKEMVTH